MHSSQSVASPSSHMAQSRCPKDVCGVCSDRGRCPYGVHLGQVDPPTPLSPSAPAAVWDIVSGAVCVAWHAPTQNTDNARGYVVRRMGSDGQDEETFFVKNSPLRWVPGPFAHPTQYFQVCTVFDEQRFSAFTLLKRVDNTRRSKHGLLSIHIPESRIMPRPICVFYQRTSSCPRPATLCHFRHVWARSVYKNCAPHLLFRFVPDDVQVPEIARALLNFGVNVRLKEDVTRKTVHFLVENWEMAQPIIDQGQIIIPTNSRLVCLSVLVASFGYVPWEEVCASKSKSVWYDPRESHSKCEIKDNSEKIGESKLKERSSNSDCPQSVPQNSNQVHKYISCSGRSETPMAKSVGATRSSNLSSPKSVLNVEPVPIQSSWSSKYGPKVVWHYKRDSRCDVMQSSLPASPKKPQNSPENAVSVMSGCGGEPNRDAIDFGLPSSPESAGFFETKVMSDASLIVESEAPIGVSSPVETNNFSEYTGESIQFAETTNYEPTKSTVDDFASGLTENYESSDTNVVEDSTCDSNINVGSDIPIESPICGIVEADTMTDTLGYTEYVQIKDISNCSKGSDIETNVCETQIDNSRASVPPEIEASAMMIELPETSKPVKSTNKSICTTLYQSNHGTLCYDANIEPRLNIEPALKTSSADSNRDPSGISKTIGENEAIILKVSQYTQTMSVRETNVSQNQKLSAKQRDNFESMSAEQISAKIRRLSVVLEAKGCSHQPADQGECETKSATPPRDEMSENPETESRFMKLKEEYERKFVNLKNLSVRKHTIFKRERDADLESHRRTVSDLKTKHSAAVGGLKSKRRAEVDDLKSKQMVTMREVRAHHLKEVAALKRENEIAITTETNKLKLKHSQELEKLRDSLKAAHLAEISAKGAGLTRERVKIYNEARALEHQFQTNFQKSQKAFTAHITKLKKAHDLELTELRDSLRAAHLAEISELLLRGARTAKEAGAKRAKEQFDNEARAMREHFQAEKLKMEKEHNAAIANLQEMITRLRKDKEVLRRSTSRSSTPSVRTSQIKPRARHALKRVRRRTVAASTRITADGSESARKRAKRATSRENGSENVPSMLNVHKSNGIPNHERSRQYKRSPTNQTSVPLIPDQLSGMSFGAQNSNGQHQSANSSLQDDTAFFQTDSILQDVISQSSSYISPTVTLSGIPTDLQVSTTLQESSTNQNSPFDRYVLPTYPDMLTSDGNDVPGYQDVPTSVNNTVPVTNTTSVAEFKYALTNSDIPTIRQDDVLNGNSTPTAQDFPTNHLNDASTLQDESIVKSEIKDELTQDEGEPVEGIVAHAHMEGQLWFKVKFHGKTPTDLDWIPESGLSGAEILISQYWENPTEQVLTPV
eukprot:26597_1